MKSSRDVFLPSGRTRFLGIIGDPIDHSLSPRLHSSVLRRLDRDLLYLPFAVSKPRLGAFLRLAPELGILGLNVTTPYKEEVLRRGVLADAAGVATGMVNTLSVRGGAVRGTSTDGLGVAAYLKQARLGDESLFLLGFGSTARSIAHALRAVGAALTIVSRRPEAVRRRLTAWRSRALVRSWRDLPDEVRPRGTGRIWISTLPAAVTEWPVSLDAATARGDCWIDLNYGAGRTPLLEVARGRGMRVADGLGPLCEQAARSLSIWLAEGIETRHFHDALGRSGRSLLPSRRSSHA